MQTITGSTWFFCCIFIHLNTETLVTAAHVDEIKHIYRKIASTKLGHLTQDMGTMHIAQKLLLYSYYYHYYSALFGKLHSNTWQGNFGPFR